MTNQRVLRAARRRRVSFVPAIPRCTKCGMGYRGPLRWCPWCLIDAKSRRRNGETAADVLMREEQELRAASEETAAGVE